MHHARRRDALAFSSFTCGSVVPLDVLGAGNFQAACNNCLFPGGDWPVTVDNQASQGLQQCIGQPLVLSLWLAQVRFTTPRLGVCRSKGGRAGHRRRLISNLRPKD